VQKSRRKRVRSGDLNKFAAEIGAEQTFLGIPGAEAKIYLVEMMPRILPTFPKEKVSKYIAKILADRGVEILTETAVQEVGEKAITFNDGSKRPYDLVILKLFKV
jgi:NADH dehydrogenase FAD-containing subunit